MSDELVIAVDCSTTACKAFAWARQGQCVADARRPIPLENPEPDGWEQDAEHWWTGFVGSVAEVAGRLGSRVADVRALIVTHQRETFVLTDAAGKPVHPALVWMDARCRGDVERLSDALGREPIHQTSGKPACTTPSLYKIAYLLGRHGALAATRPKVLDVHALLVWRATGRFATSLASADPLGLVDMRERAWSEALVRAAGLELGQLPELFEPGAELGRLRDEVADRCGLPPALPVLAGAGDGQAAGLGAGVHAEGRAYLNLGTAVVSGVLSAAYRTSTAYRTLFGLLPQSYVLESDLQGGTFIVNWLCDRLLGASRGDHEARGALLDRLATEAATIAPGADGLLVVPYWNGVMDPYWDDDARGIAIGWSGEHGPAHLYRAIVEGIALEQRLRFEGLEQAGAISEVVALGGGARSDLWCQILADVLGRPIVRARSAEATALGVAVLAAKSVGWFDSFEEATAAMTADAERFVPGPDAVRYEPIYREIYRDLYPTLRPLLVRLQRLRRAAP